MLSKAQPRNQCWPAAAALDQPCLSTELAGIEGTEGFERISLAGPLYSLCCLVEYAPSSTPNLMATLFPVYLRTPGPRYVGVPKSHPGPRTDPERCNPDGFRQADIWESPSDEEPSQIVREDIGDIHCCFLQRLREHSQAWCTRPVYPL